MPWISPLFIVSLRQMTYVWAAGAGRMGNRSVLFKCGWKINMNELSCYKSLSMCYPGKNNVSYINYILLVSRPYVRSMATINGNHNTGSSECKPWKEWSSEYQTWKTYGTTSERKIKQILEGEKDILKNGLRRNLCCATVIMEVILRNKGVHSRRKSTTDILIITL